MLSARFLFARLKFMDQQPTAKKLDFFLISESDLYILLKTVKHARHGIIGTLELLAIDLHGFGHFQHFHPGKSFGRELFFLQISRVFRHFFKNLVFTL